MKRLTVFVFALLLGASLSFAQTTGDKPTKGTTSAGDKDKGKDKDNDKGSKKGHHKGGKKTKKGNGGSSTPTPK